MSASRIAVIPGDGIGKEVISEALRTPDLDGTADTTEMGRAIAALLGPN